MFAVVGLPLSEVIHEFLAMRQFNGLRLLESHLAPESAIEAITLHKPESRRSTRR